MKYRFLSMMLSFSLMLSLLFGCGSAGDESLTDSVSDIFSDTSTDEVSIDKTTLDLTSDTEQERVPDTTHSDSQATPTPAESSAVSTDTAAPDTSIFESVTVITTASQPNTSTSIITTNAPQTQATVVITTENAPHTTSPSTTAVAPAVTTTPETEAPLVLPTSHNLQFDASKTGIYNYCPSIMQVDEKTAYIYYCTNQTSKNVTDYIGCRKGTRNADGSWNWGAETIVLSPSKSTIFNKPWDSRHACDPSVIKGKFMYNGEEYSYLMAYLGCKSNDSQDNKIGLAVSKTPDGTFTRVGTAPFIDFEYEGSVDIWEWGVGQPSIINIDKQSRIMMFYTRGDRNGTRTIVEEWNLASLDSPVRISSNKLSAKGLKTLNGTQDIMNNADFVYDASIGRYYAVSDCHPNPSDVPDYISSHFRVTYFDYTGSFTSFTWKSLSTIGTTQTGFARNHNTGVLRDAYGHLQDRYLSVFYTVSITGSDSLWSYRIYDYYVAVPK